MTHHPSVGLEGRWIRRLTALALCAALCAGFGDRAFAEALSAHPIAVAVRHGDCNAAVDLANRAFSSEDGRAVFLVGRMLDEGICIKQDGAQAAHYFARGAQLGDRGAALDYATKVGLGEGTEQSYERAGVICHDAGLDPQAKLSTYALGYACTLRGLASRLLRQQLPSEAFRDSGEVLIDFNPASAAMSIQAFPEVRREDVGTGTRLRRPLVDAPHAIQEAWESAATVVPKPDAARLINQSIRLSLDADMTLEVGRKAAEQNELANGLQTLQRTDLLPKTIH